MIKLSRHNITVGALAAISVVVLTVSTALAGGFGNRLQSSIGAGMSFAGSGTDAYGLSGMYWNPAAINTATGFDWSSNYTFVAPYSKMTTQPGSSPFLAGSSSSGNIGIDAFVPGTYGAYRINQDWTVGFAVTAPFGLGTKPDTPWKGQGLAVTSKAMVINTDAVVGYRVNDWLSIAAGPSIVYANARFSRDVSPATPQLELGTLRDLKDWGFGFTVGATVKPWQGGEFAIGYRSPVDLKLKGTLDSPFGSLPVAGKITLPDMLTLGFSQQLDPQWKVLTSVEWKNWSRVKTVPFLVRSGPGAGSEATEIDFNYRDGWNFAAGAEYEWDPKLTLRGGIAYEISPVDDDNRIPGIPDADRFWVSAGLSYALTEHISVDFGYGHAFIPNGKIRQTVLVPVSPTVSVPQPFIAKAESRIDVVSLGFRYKFGGPAVTPMPEVTKP